MTQNTKNMRFAQLNISILQENATADFSIDLKLCLMK